MRRFHLLILMAILFSLVSIVSARAPWSEGVAVPQTVETATPFPTPRPTFAATRLLYPSAPTAISGLSASLAPVAPITHGPTATPVFTKTTVYTTTEIYSAKTTEVYSATITGFVRVVGTKEPIPGARVMVGDVEIIAGEDGTLPATPIQLTDEVMDVDLEATAAGFQPWSFKGLTLRATKTHELHIELLPQGAAAPPVAPSRPAPRTSGPPPETITIALTGSSECVVPSPHENIPVYTMPFADYLRNVLPNEWVATWPDASLDAGAVAVKQYAWYSAFIARKWRSQGYNFDLLDSTCDQHYRPNSFLPATDAAIARTWWITLTRDGQLFPLYYRSHDELCAARGGEDCMGQWGSYERARAGQTGVQILLHYYAPAVVMGERYNYRVYIPAVQQP